MADLLLTLGHNASAIAVAIDDDGVARVQNAYELERLTSVKSDSHFPIEAIETLAERGEYTFDRVYVTHWDPTNKVDALKSKYWDRSFFPTNTPIFSQESLGLTHHDCHARAAITFAGQSFPAQDTYVLVIDGFGNFAEHLSYYYLDENRKPILIKRIFGYHTSLGLMYQYATAYLGLKMHEDEYKLLGYGAQVPSLKLNMARLQDIAMRETRRILKQIRSMDLVKMSPELERLPQVQAEWADRFDGMLRDAGMTAMDRDSYEARCVVGFMAQSILELTILNLFEAELRRPGNLIMTGGVALNVALNNMMLKRVVRGKLCIMPLAGDQGNSIGLWSANNATTNFDFGDLCWGRRNLESTEDELPDGMNVFEQDGDDVYAWLRGTIESTGFVNIVRGDMEFGPRALCNTSTLAVANDPKIVDEINRINGRDTVMPFAPVVWKWRMKEFFPSSDRLHRSEEFMICALDYSKELGEQFPGAALRTVNGRMTGRPQAYEQKYAEDSVGRLLLDYGILINTSFNVHGVPICCDLKDVMHSHQYQHERNPNVRTVVIIGKDEHD